MESTVECIICMQKHDKAGYLDCGHSFGATCISIWLEKSSKCPTCKLNTLKLRIFDENNLQIDELDVEQKSQPLDEEINNTRQQALESLDTNFYLEQFNQLNKELKNQVAANASEKILNRKDINQYDYVLEEIDLNIKQIVKDINNKSMQILSNPDQIFEKLQTIAEDIRNLRTCIQGYDKTDENYWGDIGDDMESEKYDDYGNYCGDYYQEECFNLESEKSYDMLYDPGWKLQGQDNIKINKFNTKILEADCKPKNKSSNNNNAKKKRKKIRNQNGQAAKKNETC